MLLLLLLLAAAAARKPLCSLQAWLEDLLADKEERQRRLQPNIKKRRQQQNQRQAKAAEQEEEEEEEASEDSWMDEIDDEVEVPAPVLTPQAAAAAAVIASHQLDAKTGSKRKRRRTADQDELGPFLGRETGLASQPLDSLMNFLKDQEIRTRADWAAMLASPHALRVLLAAAEAAGNRGELVARVVAAVSKLCG